METSARRYPTDACRYPTDGQLEHDQLFINDLAKQLVVKLQSACQLNANLGAQPKSSDIETDLIDKRTFCNYL